MLSSTMTTAREAWAAGSWDQALRHYEEAISLAVDDGDGAFVAEILRRIGDVHRERGSLELAEEAYQTSLAVAEAHGRGALICPAIMGLAAVEYHRGRLIDAASNYLRARAVAEEIGDDRLLAMIEQNLGTIANVQGNVEEALLRYRSALGCYESLGDERMVAQVLHNLGMVRVDQGKWEEAEQHLLDSLARAYHLNDSATVGNVVVSRAELELKRARYESAREHCDHAFEIFDRLGSDSGRAEVYKHYGVLYRVTEKLRLADAHFRSAIELAQRCQDRLLQAETLSEWALVHLSEERNREALHCLNDAHRLFGDLHASRELLDLDRRLDTLEGTYLRVVAAWGESIEGKDRYTAGHCERVANYACMLAEAVGITGRDLTWLRMGGYLHDVGKLAVPAEVLNKPGKLTEEEFRLMQGHTVEGDAIVAELNFPWDIRPAVRWHHERWDGSGYPDGLKGEEIPLTARILCVADVYDALTTTRSYRPAMTREQALEIMERDVGRFFDPALFPLFRSLIQQASPMRDGRFPAFGALTAVAAA